jgi:hypothetical protein
MGASVCTRHLPAGGDCLLVALKQLEELVGGVLLIPDGLRDPSDHARRIERL